MPYLIGDVAKVCGVPKETIRTWERRHGWPKPIRDKNGNRLYSIMDVQSLKRAILAKAIGKPEQPPAGKDQLITDHAVLISRLLACVTDGPQAWSTESARLEREACLVESRRLARERSRFRP